MNRASALLTGLLAAVVTLALLAGLTAAAIPAAVLVGVLAGGGRLATEVILRRREESLPAPVREGSAEAGWAERAAGAVATMEQLARSSPKGPLRSQADAVVRQGHAVRHEVRRLARMGSVLENQLLRPPSGERDAGIDGARTLLLARLSETTSVLETMAGGLGQALALSGDTVRSERLSFLTGQVEALRAGIAETERITAQTLQPAPVVGSLQAAPPAAPASKDETSVHGER